MRNIDHLRRPPLRVCLFVRLSVCVPAVLNDSVADVVSAILTRERTRRATVNSALHAAVELFRRRHLHLTDLTVQLHPLTLSMTAYSTVVVEFQVS